MSLIEMWCTYSRETGLPPTGPAYRLVNHVISRFAVPCPCCNGAGSKALDGSDSHCVGCGGFRRYLSPAAIRRAHQIVRATFPNVGSSERTDDAARRWATREYRPATTPTYLGFDTMPTSVSRAPLEDALTVASMTWRRGLRSEFLWAKYDPDLHVLWERLPNLLLPSGEPWVEVFAWMRGQVVDPDRSAQRLIQLGWTEMNPAYGWLARRKWTGTGLFKAFSVTSPGLLAAGELEWLFRLAARVRHKNTKRQTTDADSRQPVPSGPENIGPYPFWERQGHPPAPGLHLVSDDPEAQ